MKKILSLFVALLLIAGVACVANAGTDNRGNPIITSMVVNTCTHVTTSPCTVYGMTIKAETAAGWGALIDSNTTGGYDSTDAFVTAQWHNGASNYRMVMSEATQYEVDTIWFEKPLKCRNGLFFYDGIGPMAVSGGDGVTAVVYYSND